MSRTVLIVKVAAVKFGVVPTPPAPIDPTSLTDYSCQVVEARVTATANTTDIPATWCEPASVVNVPSSFALELQGLQDWTVAAGLSAYLFDNDAEQAAFALFLDGVVAPSATGIVTLAAGDFGGVAGEVLTLQQTLPILGKPEIDYGTLLMARGAEAEPEPEPEREPAGV